MASKAEYTYDEATNILTISFSGDPNRAQKIFLKPSEDYGTFVKNRGSSAYQDYFEILKDEVLRIKELDDEGQETGRNLVFKFGEGDNYSNGFYIGLGLPDSKPVWFANGTEKKFKVKYTGETPVRFSFEVI